MSIPGNVSNGGIFSTWAVPDLSAIICLFTILKATWSLTKLVLLFGGKEPFLSTFCLWVVVLSW